MIRAVVLDNISKYSIEQQHHEHLHQHQHNRYHYAIDFNIAIRSDVCSTAAVGRATAHIATGRRSLLQRHQGFTAHLKANQQAKSVTRGCLEMSMARSYGGHTFTFTYKYRY